MTDTPTSARPLIPLRAGSIRIVIAMIAVLIVMTAAQIGLPDMLGQPAAFVDFNVFHLAGQMALDGSLSAAYHTADFAPIQAAQPGYTAYMPYTYPPQFNLLAAGLGLMPTALAYLAFVGIGYGAWVWVLARIAPDQFGAAVMLCLPAAVVTARFGQNGFLSAAVIGAFCLLWLRGRSGAGIPLGVMAYKPHLAVGIAIAALGAARWRVIAWAVVVTLAGIIAATSAFGPGIWQDFRDAAGESGRFLEDGAYPLFRMTSAYAALRSFGVGAGGAMAVHICVALCALGLVGHALIRRWSGERMLAVSVMACLAVSPYNYDYDLAIAAVAIALAAPDLSRFANAIERAVLIAGMWLATGWGLLLLSVAQGPKSGLLSLGAIGVIAVFGVIFVVLRRAEGHAPRT